MVFGPYRGFFEREKKMQQENYIYRNCPIPGGGYVTGFVFHESKPDVLYCRTDIGGVYHLDPDTDRWISLIDHVTMKDLRETFPIAVALDPKLAGRVYIASGVWQSPPGKLAVSDDFGEHFTYYDMPFRVHGNLNGRGTGYRLIVDAKDSNKLYFASQADGLQISPDGGCTWEKCSSMPEDYLTFVGQTTDGGALVVGTAGVTTKRGENLRGHGLYVSYDGGATFAKLATPADGAIEGVKLAGLVPQRYMRDEKYFYVTFSIMGKNAYVLENGYSCDGGGVIGGKVVRYAIGADGHLGAPEDVTPPCPPMGSGANVTDSNAAASLGDCGGTEARSGRPHDTDENGNYIIDYGFGGIATCPQKPGLLVVSTISKCDGDCIFRSLDYGKTWEIILYDLEAGRMDFHSVYMTPQYNGGHNLIHWLTDLKINPFNCNEMWFNTGTGVFRTTNLLDDVVVFSDHCDGIEETVHLNLYAPPKGEVQLIDILGDLGGFAFKDLDTPCDNSFADEQGNRYITCINADYSDLDPDVVVVTPRGNWTGKTKGGLILSKDQCKTFRRLPMPFGLSDKIDEALSNIERPNVNSGWVAISPDCKRIGWSVACGIDLPADMVLISEDGGETFEQVNIFDMNGVQIAGSGFTSAIGENGMAQGFKIFADRMDSELFYGFGDHSDFYVSRDGGKNFYGRKLPADFPVMKFSLIDCANKTEVRGECGRQGVFYMSMKENGLWKLHYDKASDTVEVTRLGSAGDIFYRMGLGVGAPGGDYYTQNKAIYVAATIDGTYGFYRSVDDGESFVRLNTDAQMFGEVNSMEGDSRTFGRFFIATGSRGVVYGQPE